MVSNAENGWINEGYAELLSCILNIIGFKLLNSI